jgi:hypothetical protein
MGSSTSLPACRICGSTAHRMMDHPYPLSKDDARAIGGRESVEACLDCAAKDLEIARLKRALAAVHKAVDTPLPVDKYTSTSVDTPIAVDKAVDKAEARKTAQREWIKAKREAQRLAKLKASQLH